MKLNPFFLLVFGITTCCFFASCCPDCNPEFLGSFGLRSKDQAFLKSFDEPSERSRLFENQQGVSQVFNYADAAFVVNVFKENCENKGSCGDCCDEYELQETVITLRSTDLGTKVDMVLRRDFIHNTVATDTSQIGSYFSVSLNNQTIDNLFWESNPPVALLQINGKDFPDVYVIKVLDGTTDPLRRDSYAIYFQKENGIVGIEFSNGETWSLVN